MTETQLNTELRENIVAEVCDLLREKYPEIGYCHSNKLTFPVLDSLKNEKSIVITISIPKGDFDSFQAIDDYKFVCEQKAEKEKEKAKKKAEKIAKGKG